MTTIPSSEITPESIYRSRRAFMVGIGALALGAAAAGCELTRPAAPPVPTPAPDATRATTDELGGALTSFESIANYNNFYEFSTDKEAVAGRAKDFKTTPWTLAVGGLVNKPKTYGVEDLIARFGQEERIYRLRCVEGWSMVIPWLGFSLGKLLAEVEPQGNAKYVRFETLHDPERMPGQRVPWYTWPYVEGLRLDEAMHPLAILGTGLYGKALRRRTALRSGWSCPGSMASRASSRSSSSIWSSSSRPRCGWPPPRTSTASTPTSTRMWRIPAGRSRASAASASSTAGRRCPSTATPIRSPGSTPAWTCARTTEFRVPSSEFRGASATWPSVPISEARRNSPLRRPLPVAYSDLGPRTSDLGWRSTSAR
jgi:DMSO/TMAO reductase YedYZ molybdopterin-dependent catalytic subunit